MSFPDSLSVRTLVGTFLTSRGTPAKGYVVFTPVVILSDTANNNVLWPNPLKVNLNDAGSFSIDLLTTDNESIAPNQWLYRIEVAIDGVPRKEFYAALISGDDAIDITDLTIVDEADPALQDMAIISQQIETISVLASLGMRWREQWDYTAVYEANDVVAINDGIYICREDNPAINQNIYPPSNGSPWWDVLYERRTNIFTSADYESTGDISNPHTHDTFLNLDNGLSFVYDGEQWNTVNDVGWIPANHTFQTSEITGLDTALSDRPTASDVDSSIGAAIADLVDSAPSTLDTINELASALGDDANFAANVISSIGTKASQSDLDNTLSIASAALPKAGGTMTGALITAASVSGAAGLNIPAGTAPTSPNNGDIWTTTSAMLVRINGTTYTLATTAGSLQVANNLSDVANAATALAALGGVATTRTITAGTGLSGGGDLSANRTLSVLYGTTSGTAAQGNDSRLSDARTPTAHASSHASGGSDALTLAQSQVTNLTTDLAAKLVAASNLSDLASASTARTNLGLGTMATQASSSYAALTGATFTGQVFVDGSSDQIQMRVQGHSTQTNDLFRAEDSANIVLAKITNTGAGTFAGITSTAGLTVTAAAGSDRGLSLATSGSTRWMLVESSGSETGANAGSNFRLDRYSDAGALLSSPISITRATGHTDWVGSTQITGLETAVPALTVAAPASMTVDVSRWLNSAGSTYAKFGIPANNYTPSATSGTGDLALIQLATFGANVGSNISLAGRYDSSGTRANFAAMFAAKENATDGSSAGYLAFFTNSGSAFTEGVRIDSTGLLTAKSGLALTDATDITIGTSTGSKIGQSSSKLGFFGATPAAKPTGVAVSAAAVHAALVTLGLIAA